jgi:Tol biopolymer transport system component
MNKIIRSIAVILTIVVVGAGCNSSPVQVQTPDNSAVLATMIQETIQSMQGSIAKVTTSPGLPEPEEPTATLESQVPSILPNSIYFLAPGTNGKDQIWRMDKNGSGISVLTAEANGIENYDFSKTNGLLAYLTNNRIVIADSEGKIIRVLVEGPPNDGKDIWYITQRVSSPLWSPDGSQISYGYNGLNLANPDGSNLRLLLQNKYKSMEGDLVIVEEVYGPSAWSPDGKKLLINIGYYEGGSKGLINLSDNSLLRFTGGDLCCTSVWSPDGSRIITTGAAYAAGSDMWAYDTSNGAGIQLIPMQTVDGKFNYADFPFVLGTDIYFGFTSYENEMQQNSPLTLSRISMNNPADRVSLRQDSQDLLELLWASDASLAIGVLPSPGETGYPGHGPVVLIYMDDRPIQALTADGHDLRWGQ